MTDEDRKLAVKQCPYEDSGSNQTNSYIWAEGYQAACEIKNKEIADLKDCSQALAGEGRALVEDIEDDLHKIANLEKLNAEAMREIRTLEHELFRLRERQRTMIALIKDTILDFQSND